MKRKPIGTPPNTAAKALRQGEFRQRIVKAKETYSRKEKYKQRDVHQDETPLFLCAAKA